MILPDQKLPPAQARPAAADREAQAMPVLGGPGRAEALILLCIIAAFFVVWPIGEYLVDDDWIRVKSLEYLHYFGGIRLLDLNPAPLIAHLVWGALFTHLFGFSFTVARISTVVLLVLECFAVIALLRRLGASTGTTAMAALALLFNPLHFFQSFLYAPDIPAVAWSTIALLFYAKGITSKQRASGHLLLGSIFASLAWGVRQSGVLVIAGLFLYLLLYDRRRLRNLRTLLYSFLLPAIAVLLLSLWYQRAHGPTLAWIATRLENSVYLRHLSPGSAAKDFYYVFAYLGFFLLPLIAATPLHRFRPRGLSRAGLGALAASVLLVLFVAITWGKGWRFPYLRDRITQFGYFHPNELLVGARPVLWSYRVALAASFLFFLGAVGFLLRWLSVGQAQEGAPSPDRSRRAILRLVGVVLAVQLAYCFAILGVGSDRHLLIFFPAALVLFAGSLGPRPSLRTWVFAVFLLPYAFYSVAGTHDVHAFSRAAYNAGEQILAEGIDPGLLDAGYAFDGWYMYERSSREFEQGLPPLARSTPGRPPVGPWYLRDATLRIRSQFVVSLSKTMEWQKWIDAVSPASGSIAFLPRLANYRPMREYTYRSYWPPGKRPLYVLEDVTLTAPSSAAGAGTSTGR
jgi:hypothetical protein